MRRRRASADDVGFFAGVARALTPLDDADLAAVAGHLQAVDLEDGDELIAQGGAPDVVGVVEHGVVRELWLLADGTERTRAFSMRGEVCGALADALARRASRGAVRAEGPARAITLPYDVYAAMATRSPRWDTLHRRVLERLYLRKADREYELLALDARARYQALLERQPGLLEAVPLRLIASYLGITPVHLSRIRRITKPAGRAARGR